MSGAIILTNNSRAGYVGTNTVGTNSGSGGNSGYSQTTVGTQGSSYTASTNVGSPVVGTYGSGGYGGGVSSSGFMMTSSNGLSGFIMIWE